MLGDTYLRSSPTTGGRSGTGSDSEEDEFDGITPPPGTFFFSAQAAAPHVLHAEVGAFAAPPLEEEENQAGMVITELDTSTFRFECEVCGKRWRSPSDLERHMRVHSAPSCRCKVCGKVYSEHGNLIRHQRLKHPVWAALNLPAKRIQSKPKSRRQRANST